MKVGDLVRIKHPHPELIDRLAIVVVKGTWSADVHIIGSKSNWEPRLPLEQLEVIA